MILWRISNHADLSGEGGMRASARWHTIGKPVVYLADSAAAALLEVLVHFELDELPASYQLLSVQADDEIAFETPANLPAAWATDEEATREIGDEWLREGRTALLRVPSTIVPDTWNWLLNPRHDDAPRLRITSVQKQPFDPRLVRRRE